MMRFLLVLTAAFFWSVLALGQSVIPRLGVAVNMNTLGTSNLRVEPGVGIVVGVGYSHKILKKTSLQLEVNLAQKAFRSTETARFTQVAGSDTYIVDQTVKRRFNISYIEIPLFIKLHLSSQFYFLIGPTLATAVGGSASFTEKNKSSYFGEYETKGNGDIRFGQEPPGNFQHVYFDNRLDPHLQGGIGRSFGKMLVEIRYSVGSNLYDHKSSRNKTIQVSVSRPIQMKKSKARKETAQ